MRYTVFSLDMWGHVSADCTEHNCPCMVDGEHDDSACDCSEDCNAQYRCGEIEPVGDSPEDAAILDALHLDGFLNDKGRAECEVLDYSDGPLEINDREGRRIFHLKPVEDAS